MSNIFPSSASHGFALWNRKVHKRHKEEHKEHKTTGPPRIICAFCVLLVLFVIRSRFAKGLRKNNLAELSRPKRGRLL